MILLFFTIAGLIALIVAGFLERNILKKPAGTREMQKISELIQQGATTFLNKEYRIMLVFMFIFSLILYFVLPDGN